MGLIGTGSGCVPLGGHLLGQVYQLTPSDGVSLGDDIVGALALMPSDEVSLGDDIVGALALTPSDGVVLGDSSLATALVVVLSDGVLLGDTWIAEMPLTDGVYVTDSKRLGELTMGERLGADWLSMTITHPETDGIITGDERTMALSLAADGVKLGDDIAGTLALVPIDGVDLGDDIAGTLALVPIDGVDLGDDIAGTLALVPIDGVELGDDIAGTLALVPTDGVELGDAASNRILPVLTLVLESASQSAAPSIVVYLVQYDVYPALLFVIEYDPILYDDDGEYTVYLRARARDADEGDYKINTELDPKGDLGYLYVIEEGDTAETGEYYANVVIETEAGSHTSETFLLRVRAQL